MKQIIHLTVLALAFVSPLACGGIEDAELAEIESAATAVRLAGKYYFQTDSFHEDCSAGTLAVAAGPGTNNNFKNFIPRDDVTYVPYFSASSDGWSRWWCGSSAERFECSGPRNPNAQEYLRVLWDADSDDISMKCFTQCGDGSSASDCAPY